LCDRLGRIDVLNGQISVGMFLSWRMRWETVWAGFCQCVPYMFGDQSAGLPPWSSFCQFVSTHIPALTKNIRHTGVGVRMRNVSLMKSCGLAFMNSCWVGRIIIMRVGCIARALVTLNMLAIFFPSIRWSGEGRVSVNWGGSSQERWGSSH
jgi:hypothetical protein